METNFEAFVKDSSIALIGSVVMGMIMGFTLVGFAVAYALIYWSLNL